MSAMVAAQALVLFVAIGAALGLLFGLLSAVWDWWRSE